MTVDINVPYVQFVRAFYKDDDNKGKVFEGSFKYNGTIIRDVGSHARSLYMQEHTNEMKTEKHAVNAILKLCGKIRGAIIKPHVGKRKLGEMSTMNSQVINESNEKSNPITNAKWNPINNPINNLINNPIKPNAYL